MSLNFTGRTGRRNINLGNRSLHGRNRSNFLQNAGRERERREAQRRQEAAAITLQSALRRHRDLAVQRQQLSSGWQGDLRQFRFFFPEECAVQPTERSLQQLDLLDSVDLTIVSRFEVRRTEESLALSIDRLLLAESPRYQLVERLFRSLDRLLDAYGNCGVSLDRLLTWLYTIAGKSPFFYDEAWKYTALCSHEPIVDLLWCTSPARDFVNLTLQNESSTARIDPVLRDVMASFVRPGNLDAVTSTSRIARACFTENVCRLFFFQGESHYVPLTDTTSVTFWSILLETMGRKESSAAPEAAHDIYLTSFPRYALAAASNDLQLFTHFLYAALQYSPTSECQNNLMIGSIVAAGQLDLLNTLFAALRTEPAFQAFTVVSSTGPPWSVLFNAQPGFFRALFVFEELYSYVLSVTHDADLFSEGKLSKDNFAEFVHFLKSFVVAVVLDFRNHFKDYSESPLLPYLDELATMSLKLLRQTYMRNLRLKLFPEQFWYLQSATDFSTKSVIPVLGSLSDLHEKPFSVFDSSATLSGPQQQISSILVLTFIPYMVPFEQRADLFHALIDTDKERIGGWFAAKTHGTISRDNVLFDAYDQFGSLPGEQFKRPLSVEFLNKFGEKEAGIDGGGLTKELLTSVVNSAFIPSEENTEQNAGFQFFDHTSDAQLYPSAQYFLELKYAQQHPEQTRYTMESRTFILQMLRFLGMVVGKCLYENVLIDVSFAPFFLNRWASALNQESQRYRNSFDDLQSFDLELYQSLVKLLRFSPAEIDAMDLTFSVTERMANPGTSSSDMMTLSLVPGGKAIPVTAANKLQYVYAVAKYKLDQRISVQTSHFLEGLFEVIPPQWLSLFNPYELQTLISGGEKEIDIDDLERNVVYGGYVRQDETVQFLFEILHEMSAEDKSKFLKFVTSSSKQPLLGFKELTPQFGIRNSGSDRARLPTASTCVNLLKLPDYKDKSLLRQKLLYSINANAGFDLS